jgi:hypothetical protein
MKLAPLASFSESRYAADRSQSAAGDLMEHFCQNVRAPLQESWSGGITHAKFICMGRRAHKAAGWAATSPSFHTMSNLPADDSPPY